MIFNFRNTKEKNHENLDLYHVDENLELGTFYLKKLLQNFRMNFKKMLRD